MRHYYLEQPIENTTGSAFEWKATVGGSTVTGTLYEVREAIAKQLRRESLTKRGAPKKQKGQQHGRTDNTAAG